MTTKSWPYVGLVGFKTFPRWPLGSPEIPDVKPSEDTVGWVASPRRDVRVVDDLLPVFKAGEKGQFWRYGVYRPKRST